jgi:hypothetical protein
LGPRFRGRSGSCSWGSMAEPEAAARSSKPETLALTLGHLPRPDSALLDPGAISGFVSSEGLERLATRCRENGQAAAGVRSGSPGSAPAPRGRDRAQLVQLTGHRRGAPQWRSQATATCSPSCWRRRLGWTARRLGREGFRLEAGLTPRLEPPAQGISRSRSCPSSSYAHAPSRRAWPKRSRDYFFAFASSRSLGITSSSKRSAM